MKLQEVLLCAAFAVAMPVGQLLFKTAALYQARLEGPLPLRLLMNYPLMGAFAWYAATALFWFYILTRLPLSIAYSFSILGSALVPLLAGLIFKEPMSWRFVVGYALMFSGFLVILRGTQA
jgi:drug/metabolite transporter (DMT)-like permease